MSGLVKLLITTIAVGATAYLLPGVQLSDNIWIIILVAAVISLLNVTVKPLLTILTFPITVVTFGLFLLVINAVIILIAGALIDGFSVDNFWWALLFSLIVSMIVSLLDNNRERG